MRIILSPILLLLFNLSLAQCWNLRDKSVNKVIALYETADFDSINVVLEEWSSTCEMNEELFRLSILNAIHAHRNLDSLVDKNIIGYIRAYESKQMESFIPYFHAQSLASSPGSDQLDAVTVRWGNTLNSTDSLTSLFLTVYQSDHAKAAWNALKNNSFPNTLIQDSFNEISRINTEKYVTLKAGGYLHFISQTPAAEIGLSFGQINSNTYQSFGGAIRFGSSDNIELDYRSQENTITANSLYLHFDYGKVIRNPMSDQIFFGTIGYTSFLSEYVFEEDRKRVVSLLNLGIGGRIMAKSKQTNRFGLEIRYLPLNLVTSKKVEMNAASFSINLTYHILNSRIAREFMRPIGYYD